MTDLVRGHFFTMTLMTDQLKFKDTSFILVFFQLVTGLIKDC